MPEELKKSEIDSETDPSVAKQYDNETPKSEQIKDLYGLIDNTHACMFSTARPNVGPVGRSMGVAKRNGPDLLFLANKHSTKFHDLENDKTVHVTIQDQKTQDWVSITGKAVTTSNDDPRIKDLYSKFIAAWFGDLGDGVHDGSADDPRMSLIEVKATHVAYWKRSTGTLGFAKEVGQAVLQGKVADTGYLRELDESDLEKARSEA